MKYDFPFYNVQDRDDEENGKVEKELDGDFAFAELGFLTTGRLVENYARTFTTEKRDPKPRQNDTSINNMCNCLYGGCNESVARFYSCCHLLQKLPNPRRITETPQQPISKPRPLPSKKSSECDGESDTDSEPGDGVEVKAKVCVVHGRHVFSPSGPTGNTMSFMRRNSISTILNELYVFGESQSWGVIPEKQREICHEDEELGYYFFVLRDAGQEDSDRVNTNDISAYTNNELDALMDGARKFDPSLRSIDKNEILRNDIARIGMGEETMILPDYIIRECKGNMIMMGVRSSLCYTRRSCFDLISIDVPLPKNKPKIANYFKRISKVRVMFPKYPQTDQEKRLKFDDDDDDEEEEGEEIVEEEKKVKEHLKKKREPQEPPNFIDGEVVIMGQSGPGYSLIEKMKISCGWRNSPFVQLFETTVTQWMTQNHVKKDHSMEISKLSVRLEDKKALFNSSLERLLKSRLLGYVYINPTFGRKLDFLGMRILEHFRFVTGLLDLLIRQTKYPAIIDFWSHFINERHYFVNETLKQLQHDLSLHQYRYSADCSEYYNEHQHRLQTLKIVIDDIFSFRKEVEGRKCERLLWKIMKRKKPIIREWEKKKKKKKPSTTNSQQTRRHLKTDLVKRIQEILHYSKKKLCRLPCRVLRKKVSDYRPYREIEATIVDGMSGSTVRLVTEDKYEVKVLGMIGWGAPDPPNMKYFEYMTNFGSKMVHDEFLSGNGSIPSEEELKELIKNSRMAKEKRKKMMMLEKRKK